MISLEEFENLESAFIDLCALASVTAKNFGLSRFNAKVDAIVIRYAKEKERILNEKNNYID